MKTGNFGASKTPNGESSDSKGPNILVRLTYVLLALFALCSGAVAQTKAPPALIADLVRYDPVADELVATGNVEIFFDGRVLKARKVTYRNATGDIDVEGPLTIRDQSGAILVGQTASLDQNLERGLLLGARLVLAENFQFAADRARKVNNRYTTLDRTVGSACKICNESDVPVWLIRADRVIHDQEEKRIHFEGARFELLGVPVAYFPYFYAPDPSVRRASGFLSPQFKDSDIFGFGLRIPYYIVLDEHSDLTLTPFLTTRGANLLEGEYRQRFTNGELDVNGAIAIDDNPALPNVRAFLDAEASFRLKKKYVADVAVNWSSDNAFLNEYGFSSADRLTSNARLSRQLDSNYFEVEAVGFQSLRDNVDDRTLPIVLPRVLYDRYWDNGPLGGRLGFEADATGLTRLSGRDVMSFGAAGSWKASRTLANGMQTSATAQIEGRGYYTQDDPAFPNRLETVLRPAVAAEIRWPFARVHGRRTQVIEPVFQLVYSDIFGSPGNIPNEDSSTLEFDAANLFSINRFAGRDKAETGLRANVGVTFTQISDTGWNYAVTIGQVFRTAPSTDFPSTTGLNDTSSNFVAATNISLPPYFSLSNQTLLSNSFDLERNDIQVDLDLDRFDLSASYVFLAADPSVNLTQTQQEITLDGRYQAAPNWALDFKWRRNLQQADDVTAAAGIEYGNECIRTRFSVSRRFTNSNSLPASTEFGFSVSLAGLGGSTEKWPAQSCATPY